MEKEEQIKDLKVKITECERIIQQEREVNPIADQDWIVKHYGIKIIYYQQVLAELEKEPINMSEIYCKGA